MRARRAARARPTGGRPCPRRRRSGRSPCSSTDASTRRSTRARPGCDLVDGAVQVVDAALERDRELDQVLAAAADQHPLRVAQPADAHPRDPGERDPDCPQRRRRGRRSARRRSRRRAPALLRQREDDLVLGGVVRLRSTSPGTGSTSTFTVVCARTAPRRVARRSRSTLSPGLISGICSRLDDRLAGALGSIVSVTGIRPPARRRESWTVTSNDSSVVAVTVFSCPGVSVFEAPPRRSGALHRHDVRAVQADRRAARRGAADPLQHELHRRLRSIRSASRRSATRARSRRRRRRSCSCARGRAEEVVPDDVARERAGSPARRAGRSRGRALPSSLFEARGRLERVGEAVERRSRAARARR